MSDLAALKSVRFADWDYPAGLDVLENRDSQAAADIPDNPAQDTLAADLDNLDIGLDVLAAMAGRIAPEADSPACRLNPVLPAILVDLVGIAGNDLYDDGIQIAVLDNLQVTAGTTYFRLADSKNHSFFLLCAAYSFHSEAAKCINTL